MHRILTVAAVVLAFACGNDKDSKPSSSAPDNNQSANTPAPKNNKPAPDKTVAAPVDPQLAELFAEGKDCTWNQYGVASCKTAKKIAKLAFNKQSNRELAASCAAALKDPTPSTRGLAATCLKSFNERTQTPHMAAGLDAFEAEIVRHPEVMECYTMAGIWDYVLKIVTRDIAHYEAFVRNTLTTSPSIRELHSHMAVTEIRNSTALPLDTQL